MKGFDGWTHVGFRWRYIDDGSFDDWKTGLAGPRLRGGRAGGSYQISVLSHSLRNVCRPTHTSRGEGVWVWWEVWVVET